MNEAESGASRPEGEGFPGIEREALNAGDGDDAHVPVSGQGEEASDLDDDLSSAPLHHRLSATGAEIGVDVLRRLLDLMGLEGDVLCERNGESVVLNIEGDDLGVLIGRRGMTLSALQYMVRLMIASREAEWPVVTVDVCGYKRRRYNALQDLARKLADQAKYRRRPMTLEPLPADERRAIHLALANHPDVYTESVGVDMERKVVIHPRER